jgi:hypothetical protein
MSQVCVGCGVECYCGADGCSCGPYCSEACERIGSGEPGDTCPVVVESDESIAAPGCYLCDGTGKIRGFGKSHGKTCPCVATCFECEAPIAWEHDDSPRPTECADCLARLAREVA